MPRKWEPFITVRAVQPVVAALSSLGYDVDEILKRCNFNRSILQDADARIPHRAVMQFWHEAQATTHDDHLGMHLAEAAPIESFGVHAYALISSPTLREAFRRACRYQRLIHEITDLVFQEKENQSSLRHALPGGHSVPRQPAEFLVALWVRFGRLITADHWSPLRVNFAHAAPKDTTEHERVFQADLRFNSGQTAICIANEDLDRPNRKADIGLVRVLDDYAEHLLEQMPRNDTTSERVRVQLLEELKGGTPTAESVAQALHVSVRTLHRNLRREGTTFRKLLNQLRHEQAVQYLQDSAISISEVGFLLGFSELSSFYRAFKSWTGTTPAEYRVASHPVNSQFG